VCISELGHRAAQERNRVDKRRPHRGKGGASGAYAQINTQNFVGAAKEMSSKTDVRMKNKAGKFVSVLAPGLIARRAEESAPFRK
jgi:lysozyme